MSDEPGVGGEFLSSQGWALAQGKEKRFKMTHLRTKSRSLHHLIQTTIYPKHQIWSLHSLLEIPGASSHPQNEVLVPLWALQWP